MCWPFIVIRFLVFITCYWIKYLTIGLKLEGKFGREIKIQNGKEEYKDELLIVNFDDVSPKGIKFNRLHKTTWELNLNIFTYYTKN